MNAEELKMVVDMVASLGANGKEAFVWWLLTDKVLGYVVGLCVLFTLSGLGVYVVRTIRLANAETQFLKEIRSLVFSEGYSFYSYGDHTRVMQELRRLKEKDAQ